MLTRHLFSEPFEITIMGQKMRFAIELAFLCHFGFRLLLFRSGVVDY